MDAHLDPPEGTGPSASHLAGPWRTSVPDFGRVVVLEGQFDYTTAAAVSEAISCETGNVLVDLTSCTFLDPAVIGKLLAHARTLQPAHERLEIVAPSENRTIARLLEVLGIADLVPVRQLQAEVESVCVLEGH
jgi:anti-anti-sigma regulatory factor